MIRRVLTMMLIALPLAGCSIPSVSDRPSDSREDTVRPQPAPVANSAAARQCHAMLAAAGTQFTPLPDRYLGEGCSNLDTVQVHALLGEGSTLDVSNIGPVTCPVSAAFAAWARFGVDRAARSIMGTPLVSIQTFGSYSCRNVAGSGRRSAHATAEAIDISGFTFADGRRITIQGNWNGSREEREFLRAVQASACRRFDTVLGPEYNAAHRDHFHLEGVIDGRGFCR